MKSWLKPYRARLRYLKYVLLMMAALTLGLLAPAAGANSQYTGQNPVQTGCTNGAQNIGGKSTVRMNEFSATIEILNSPACPYAVWVALNVSSGANGQYQVKIHLSGGNSGESVTLEEVVRSSLVQTPMLNAEGGCINAEVSISNLSGTNRSIEKYGLCGEVFVLPESTSPGEQPPSEPPSWPPPVESFPPGQTTTTTTTITTTSSGSTTITSSSTAGSTVPIVAPPNNPPSQYHSVKHRRCWGKHHHRIKCPRHSKHKKH